MKKLLFLFLLGFAAMACAQNSTGISAIPVFPSQYTLPPYLTDNNLVPTSNPLNENELLLCEESLVKARALKTKLDTGKFNFECTTTFTSFCVVILANFELKPLIITESYDAIKNNIIFLGASESEANSKTPAILLLSYYACEPNFICSNVRPAVQRTMGQYSLDGYRCVNEKINEKIRLLNSEAETLEYSGIQDFHAGAKAAYDEYLSASVLSKKHHSQNTSTYSGSYAHYKYQTEEVLNGIPAGASPYALNLMIDDGQHIFSISSVFLSEMNKSRKEAEKQLLVRSDEANVALSNMNLNLGELEKFSPKETYDQAVLLFYSPKHSVSLSPSEEYYKMRELAIDAENQIGYGKTWNARNSTRGYLSDSYSNLTLGMLKAQNASEKILGLKEKMLDLDSDSKTKLIEIENELEKAINGLNLAGETGRKTRQDFISSKTAIFSIKEEGNLSSKINIRYSKYRMYEQLLYLIKSAENVKSEAKAKKELLSILEQLNETIKTGEEEEVDVAGEKQFLRTTSAEIEDFNDSEMAKKAELARACIEEIKNKAYLKYKNELELRRSEIKKSVSLLSQSDLAEFLKYEQYFSGSILSKSAFGNYKKMLDSFIKLQSTSEGSSNTQLKNSTQIEESITFTSPFELGVPTPFKYMLTFKNFQAVSIERLILSHRADNGVSDLSFQYKSDGINTYAYSDKIITVSLNFSPYSQEYIVFEGEGEFLRLENKKISNSLSGRDLYVTILYEFSSDYENDFKFRESIAYLPYETSITYDGTDAVCFIESAGGRTFASSNLRIKKGKSSAELFYKLSNAIDIESSCEDSTEGTVCIVSVVSNEDIANTVLDGISNYKPYSSNSTRIDSFNLNGTYSDRIYFGSLEKGEEKSVLVSFDRKNATILFPENSNRSEELKNLLESQRRLKNLSTSADPLSPNAAEKINKTLLSELKSLDKEIQKLKSKIVKISPIAGEGLLISIQEVEAKANKAYLSEGNLILQAELADISNRTQAVSESFRLEINNVYAKLNMQKLQFEEEKTLWEESASLLRSSLKIDLDSEYKKIEVNLSDYMPDGAIDKEVKKMEKFFENFNEIPSNKSESFILDSIIEISELSGKLERLNSSISQNSEALGMLKERSLRELGDAESSYKQFDSFAPKEAQYLQERQFLNDILSSSRKNMDNGKYGNSIFLSEYLSLRVSLLKSKIEKSKNENANKLLENLAMLFALIAIFSLAYLFWRKTQEKSKEKKRRRKVKRFEERKTEPSEKTEEDDLF